MADSRKPRRITTGAQREAARRNGSKSRGPKSDEGKRRSSLNAVRHALTSSLIILTVEDRAMFNQLVARYVEEFQPEGEFEHDLIEEMAVAKWRQKRTWGFQTAILDARIERMAGQIKAEFDVIDTATIGALAFAEEADRSQALALMQRYEAMHARHFRRTWKDLIAHQEHRKQKLQNEPDKALSPVTPTRPALAACGPNKPAVDLDPAITPAAAAELPARPPAVSECHGATGRPGAVHARPRATDTRIHPSGTLVATHRNMDHRFIPAGSPRSGDVSRALRYSQPPEAGCVEYGFPGIGFANPAGLR